MSLHATYFKKSFHFNFKARTSRGLMKDKTSWFIRLEDNGNPAIFGIGECGPLPGLSTDDIPDFETQLGNIIDQINASAIPDTAFATVAPLIPSEYSSIIFGMETALLDLANGGQRVIFPNAFIEGKPIDINGLVWMGDMDFMMDQINKKISEGFRCIKLKVGGLDFDRECDILSYIRRRYFRENITIRLDANGAFKPDDVLYKLTELARFDVHSIEQPVKPRLKEMEELCRKSPIPVAFDEELIGITETQHKSELLTRLKPQYIVLKPTLHGGLSSCAEWIRIAESLNIGWWITSALESSIGLNAICQFTAAYDPRTPQGLGTGGIYADNFASPLMVRDGQIFYDRAGQWSVIGDQ
ncbi:MAG TPA: o-succinylbenzoate synthase [Chryseosolibacter sp.]|nr:o-succinylbenzoate synthase [Chryseosolibacter sp.]